MIYNSSPQFLYKLDIVFWSYLLYFILQIDIEIWNLLMSYKKLNFKLI